VALKALDAQKGCFGLCFNLHPLAPDFLRAIFMRLPSRGNPAAFGNDDALFPEASHLSLEGNKNINRFLVILIFAEKKLYTGRFAETPQFVILAHFVHHFCTKK